ncbi:MAG TPA: cyclodeaminase/cyclohydrolase family protein [Bryobacteraceae bacterium]|nr:cyclodeaminase/cyclohydrolase family protein [Bryobacteraceae bacterium]
MSSSFSFITDARPTGVVEVAAASAALALRVLHGVLEIAGRKYKEEEVGELLGAAAQEAHNLVRLAGEDAVAYTAYVEARRKRDQNAQTALQHAIETPLAAARSAAAGIDLCRRALPFARGAIAADVGGAALLLAGAVRAILACASTNLGAVENAEFTRAVLVEREALERLALRESEAVAEAAQGQVGRT